MAKVRDLEVLRYAVVAQLAMQDSHLLSLIGEDCAIWCVMGIYLTNDQTSGYGQDFKPQTPSDDFGQVDKVSIISYRNGVSVILDSASSRYQDSVDLCGYENLNEDVHAIVMYINTAIERINVGV